MSNYEIITWTISFSIICLLVISIEDTMRCKKGKIKLIDETNSKGIFKKIFLINLLCSILEVVLVLVGINIRYVITFAIIYNFFFFISICYNTTSII